MNPPSLLRAGSCKRRFWAMMIVPHGPSPRPDPGQPPPQAHRGPLNRTSLPRD